MLLPNKKSNIYDHALFKLKQLLEYGEKLTHLRSRKRSLDAGAEPDAKSIRSQFGLVYTWVTEHNLRGARGAAQFHADAVKELKEGRPHLLDFAKKHGDGLQYQLDFVWHVSEAFALLVGVGAP